MIYIMEKFQNSLSVKIQVDGSLDAATLPILKDILERRRGKGKKVFLHIDGLTRISREGMNYLKEISKEARIIVHDDFLKLDGEDLKGR